MLACRRGAVAPEVTTRSGQLSRLSVAKVSRKRRQRQAARYPVSFSLSGQQEKADVVASRVELIAAPSLQLHLRLPHHGR
eukprot:365319-Chlamydomonas_euryale.AAC.4